jgi:hypothetical protein
MTDAPSSADRRTLLQAAATLAGAGLGPASAAPADPPEAAPGPAMTGPGVGNPSPGQLGDFNFLSGHWRVLNHKRKGEGWDVFEGESRCFSLLDGLCSVEELRIPARNFNGMAVRLLDLKSRRWSDHWTNANAGLLTAPGLQGSFEGGAAIFEERDEEAGKPVIYRSVWDLITRESCRWQQGASRDGGRSWVIDWSMRWVRIA